MAEVATTTNQQSAKVALARTFITPLTPTTTAGADLRHPRPTLSTRSTDQQPRDLGRSDRGRMTTNHLPLRFAASLVATLPPACASDGESGRGDRTACEPAKPVLQERKRGIWFNAWPRVSRANRPPIEVFVKLFSTFLVCRLQG